jgi:hypothetical protein
LHSTRVHLRDRTRHAAGSVVTFWDRA